jgi:hypothetical protein
VPDVRRRDVIALLGGAAGADPFTVANRASIISLAERYRLPAIFQFRQFAMDGGLMSYGPARPIFSGGLPHTSIASSKAPSPPTCRSSSPPSSGWLSILRPPSARARRSRQAARDRRRGHRVMALASCQSGASKRSTVWTLISGRSSVATVTSVLSSVAVSSLPQWTKPKRCDWHARKIALVAKERFANAGLMQT